MFAVGNASNALAYLAGNRYQWDDSVTSSVVVEQGEHGTEP